ncbi:MAG TPA: DUF3152 domain-containing protein [Candidatus Saccharimonadales bacterium]|nr:DUF3152 domain-containing protein [Candidatus Saccharimonadales bacterium]
MRVIDHRQLGKAARRRPHWMVWAGWGLAGIAGLFIAGNIVLGVLYRNKVLPNYSLGSVAVGSIPFSRLAERVPSEKLLTKSVEIYKQDVTRAVRTADLGISVDWQRTERELRSSRTFLPLATLFTKHQVPVMLKTDQQKLDRATEKLKPVFVKAALPERITFNGAAFVINPPAPGYELDMSSFKTAVRQAVSHGKVRFEVPVAGTHSVEPQGKLDAELQRLQKQLQTDISYTQPGGVVLKPSPADIGNWYVPSGQTMAVSQERITQYLLAKQPAAANGADGAAAAMHAISSGQKVTFILTDATAKKYTYCAALRGVDGAYLDAFVYKLAATYGDPRGWGAAGRISLVRVMSGCDFTVWLSAPAAMPGFGAICDAYYSCRVGPNVVINFDRWQGATDPWNHAGGSLQDYRVMVINHETGHWFGFNHAGCPGPGLPAPVMMQQSIGLGGCTFNPWPTSGEVNTLKQVLSIAVVRSREDVGLASAPYGCSHCATV